ncbi:MAG: hypothetical protein JO372_21970, partial [Solirubrobacterales bacterium]|nr:hypothetical protein [Solirubrobacterales bacterium]
ASVEIAASEPGSSTNTTALIGTVADAQGRFSATIPTPSGATVITVAVAVGNRSTGWTQETVTGA